MHPTLAVKEKLQALWSLWANEADAAGMTDIYGLQALAFRSMVEGGECFARRYDRNLREGLSVPLQFQLIEAEQLPFYLARPTLNTPQGNVVRASIEFDPSGRRTTYYSQKQHPGERIFSPTDLELMRVPAAEVMHLFRSLRLGQLRGVPWMANALLRLWEPDQYHDAKAVKRSRVFIYQFCRRTYRTFVEQAVLAGKLGARDYIANWDDYLAVQWHRPKWAWVDPEKDEDSRTLQAHQVSHPRQPTPSAYLLRFDVRAVRAFTAISVAKIGRSTGISELPGSSARVTAAARSANS